MTFPQFLDTKEIRDIRFDEQGGKCYYCGCQMLRDIPYRKGGGQPWYLCTLEHLTDRLDPRRWDRNTDDSPIRYAAACARCNHARSAWSQRHAPKELIDLLSRNPERKTGREIVTEYYQTREYVPPPPFKPEQCVSPIKAEPVSEVEEFDNKVGTDVPPPEPIEFVLFYTLEKSSPNGVEIRILQKNRLPAKVIYMGDRTLATHSYGVYCDEEFWFSNKQFGFNYTILLKNKML